MYVPTNKQIIIFQNLGLLSQLRQGKGFQMFPGATEHCRGYGNMLTAS